MPSLFSTYNYIVPASGTTSAYLVQFKGVAGDPTSIDFSQISQNGQPFLPSGVVIDNTNGAIAVLQIMPLGFNIIIPAGKQMGLTYPAPQGHTVNFINITAPMTVLFVDYPVIPYQF